MVLRIEDEVSKNYYQDFSELIAYRDLNYPEPKSEYVDDYDVALDGINYDIVNYRSDIGMSSSSQKCITLGGYGNQESEAGRGLIRGREITDGINSFSFQARLPFSPESKYPQGNGKDKASISKITLIIYQNGSLVKKILFQFPTDNEANKGQIFSAENLKISGTYTFELDIDSGHRATIAYVKWDSYKSI